MFKAVCHLTKLLLIKCWVDTYIYNGLNGMGGGGGGANGGTWE